MQKLNKKKFLIAGSASLLLAVTLFYLSNDLGKENLFLLLNKDEGSFADNFFYIFTFGGDALMWIPVLFIVIFLLKRKDAIVLLIAAFALSTIFVQGIKNLIPEDRPVKAIANTSLIHTVEGVEVHTINSFPSGHSTTAFCIYFIFCLLIKKKWWIVVGFIYAATVGYSRIYLAQHFPFDVAGGIVTAIITVLLSVFIQQYWWQRKQV